MTHDETRSELTIDGRIFHLHLLPIKKSLDLAETTPLDLSPQGFKLGQLEARLLRRFPSDTGSQDASSLAFDLLSDAIRSAGATQREQVRLTPETPVSRVWPRTANALSVVLRSRYDLRLCSNEAGALGALTSLAGIAALLVLFFSIVFFEWSVALGCLLALTAAAAVYPRLPSTFAHDATLGSLSEELVDYNLKRIVDLGGRISGSRARFAVRRIIARANKLRPEKLGPDTRLRSSTGSIVFNGYRPPPRETSGVSPRSWS